VAREYGHQLGIYYPASVANDTEQPTYIHSKFLLVDDRFLSVGSANVNNRSMGYDTELNVAWEAEQENRELAQAIANIRIDLLAEHTGQTDPASRKTLAAIPGLVTRLDRLADEPSTRLHHHPLQSISEEYRWVMTLLPDGLPFDSERSEDAYETISNNGVRSLFSQGMMNLKNWFLNGA
jgi:phosphatidylserine/phosphatidylglycerophosphate/cardiolipin synthase-like enzyme